MASFKTILEKIGQDVKGTFAFLGSQKGQAILGAGEGVVEAEVPAATGLINVANNWLTEIFKEETLATAAGQQNGTGPQKAAAVISAVTPSALQFAQQQGLKLTDAQLQAANTALVAFANAFTPPAA